MVTCPTLHILTREDVTGGSSSTANGLNGGNKNTTATAGNGGNGNTVRIDDADFQIVESSLTLCAM